MRCHFKHCREIAASLRGKPINEAIRYLRHVLTHQEAIPVRRYRYGHAAHALGKRYESNGVQCFFPEKATRFFYGMLMNARANAIAKKLEAKNLVISHVLAQRAPNQRRRTYRAHGRINAYLSNPAHLEVILSEKTKVAKKAKFVSKAKVTPKAASIMRRQKAARAVAVDAKKKARAAKKAAKAAK